MIAAYLALFVAVGAGFLLVNLLIGKLLRPHSPSREKREIYECGEPTIGSSFVQFDLRFYVVALLFVIFDVEVALLFPWAVVFGKATHLMDPRIAEVAADTAGSDPADGPNGSAGLSPNARAVFAELGVPQPATQAIDAAEASDPQAANLAAQSLGRKIAWLALVEIAIFFAVLLVGFAYVWRRGDLDWVRAINRQRTAPAEFPATIGEPSGGAPAPGEPVGAV
jgi:NADH-quinone oxidoreductase subunit A